MSAPLSKNALKKQQKAAEAAKKKAEKEAAKKAQAEAQGASGGGGKKAALVVDESGMDPTQYFENRTKMLKMLEDEGINAYPHKFNADMQLSDFVTAFNASINDGEHKEDVNVSLAGRITSVRQQGKLVFIDINGDGAKVQIMTDAKTYAESEEVWSKIISVLRRGDVIGCVGFPGKSKKGELSVFPTKLQLLSPCMHMLPREIKNVEIRFRQRYLDLLLHPDKRRIFEVRAQIINYVRRFLDERNFLEVETPMMNMLAGGATARPFKTKHNELNMDMYMRIAPELYLKQLVIGGLDRVYELGRQFRNEGMDQTHNPEFTTCEFYMAYADYNDLMDMTELMVSEMVKAITGDYKIKYTNSNGVEEIDFSTPWKRISMMEGLAQNLSEDFPILGKFEFPDPNGPAMKQYLIDLFAKIGKEPKAPLTVARMIDQLVGDHLESRCLHPTFITEHPEVMSPLAKYHRSKPGLTERFELFVNHRELCNAYTELNNPKVQRERFTVQASQGQEGDDEAMVKDEDFCTALEYALPPTGGWGMGIDRLAMFLTDTDSIREVLLFPAMKPIGHGENKAPKPVSAPTPQTAATSAPVVESVSIPTCPSTFIKCLPKVDVGTSEGLTFIDNHLSGSNYLGGSTSPTSADNELFNALTKFPFGVINTFSNIKRWHAMVGLFLPFIRDSWPSLATNIDTSAAALTAAPVAPVAAKKSPVTASKKPAPKKVEEDDELDLGFDDDEEEEEEDNAANKPKSRAEQAAELKKKRDAELEEKKAAAMARLAKKEANQRSLCNLEIKPWESDQDLLALFEKIKKTVVKDGLKWSENCALVDVAFGIKKLVLTAVISLNLSMDAIIEEMTEEIFADEIQSMQMTSMSLL